jgi:hypothetical protein
VRCIPAGVWFAIACEAEQHFGHRSTWTETADKQQAVAQWIQQRVRALLNGEAEPPRPAPAPVRMWTDPEPVQVGRWDDVEDL